MEHRKWFVSLIGAGLALGMPLQGFAQEAAGEEVPAVEAESAAPAEMPTRTPSFLPTSLPVAKASSFSTGMISS